jgi:hypothetical protein
MTTILLALAVAAGAHGSQQVSGQTPPPPALQVPVAAQPPASQDPPPQASPPKPTIEIARVAALTPLELQVRHDNLSMMESVLTRAVFNGARSFTVNSQVTVGFAAGQQPRTRGFELEGYGLFFDVEVPDIDLGIEMTMQQFQREMQKLTEEKQAQASPAARRTTPAAQLVPVPDTDPSEPYRQAVITACTNAMLDYSKNLDVQPNEWLTVALRGSEVSLGPTLGRDPHTRILRVKGSDLADFMASRITREEAIKRVEKREF